MTVSSLSAPSKVGLRAKGVAVLSIPVAALLLALAWTYATQTALRDAGSDALRAIEARADLLQIETLALDPDASPSALERSLRRVEAVAGEGPTAAIRAALARRGQIIAEGPAAGAWKTAIADIRAGLAPLLRRQDLLLLDAESRRGAAETALSRVIVISGAIGCVGAFILLWVIAGRVGRRVGAAGENARRLAHGLPLEPAPARSDEIGALEARIQEAAGLLRARERELRESEQRYRDLFDRAPVPYEETDRDGIVRRINQEVCAVLKCSKERVLGQPAWDFVVADQREAFRRAMLERVAGGIETPPFECECQLDDGTRIVVEIRESLIRDQAGAVTGVCRSLLDVTERKLASVAARKVAQYAMELRNKNEQLAHALETARSATLAKSRFLAGVSHELRTPLNSIIGFSELLYDGKLGHVPEEHREILSDILSSARHLLQVISDILDLSKVEAGRMEFHPERVTLDPLVQEVRDVIRPLSERKAIHVSTESPCGFAAMLDASRFKQVLYNYLSNAVKFTPQGGRVVVRIVPADAAFRLEVEDTGVGIRPDDISKLFQDFQQLSNGPRNEQGTGLGLALTRHIVEAQGGSVGVRSIPGQGSVFTATLPLNTCDAAGVR